ncbi:MAG: cold shock domain-containing protein [Planctomycetaceae bacterium]|nr:cold shock domain-containing protein [Planctomycetaceae bacterium]
MTAGKVKWYDKKKGYGFILSEDGCDIFVHYTSFAETSVRSLNDGEDVTFDIVPGEKGPRAQNVTRNAVKKSSSASGV